ISKKFPSKIRDQVFKARPLENVEERDSLVGCKVGGVVSIRDKDEIGAFLSTQVIRPPYDLAPLAYLFDELFFSVPRMRISLQCPSLQLSTMDFQ
ncbi:hypothetical protein V1478_017321, partial [Vespula squamosa]